MSGDHPKKSAITVGRFSSDAVQIEGVSEVQTLVNDSSSTGISNVVFGLMIHWSISGVMSSTEKMDKFAALLVKNVYITKKSSFHDIVMFYYTLLATETYMLRYGMLSLY